MAVMFAALLGGVWYFELREGADSAKPKAAAGAPAEPEEHTVFDDVDWEKLARIELVSPAQVGAIVVERNVAGEDRVWRIVAPLSTEADSSAIDTFVGTLKNLKAETVVADPSKDLAPFGLAAPSTQVKLVFALGGRAKTERMLFAGDKAPVGYKAYFKRGDRPDILLTGAYTKTALEKKVFDLRDKSLLTAEKAAVRKLELVSAAGDVTLVESGGGWSLEAPAKARAASAEVDKILSSLTGLRAVDVATEDAGDGRAYGLDQPSIRAVVTTGEGDAATRHELAFGTVDEAQKRVYVRDMARKPVFLVSSYSIEGLKKSAGDLRDKKVLGFDKDAVARIEIHAPGGALALARKADASAAPAKNDKAEPGEKADHGKWVVETPSSADADQANVNQMLITLAGLEAKQFLDGDLRPLPVDSGLEEPELSVRLLGDGAKELGTLDVGSAVPGTGSAGGEGVAATPPDRYVRIGGYDTVFVVGGRFLDDVPRRADDLTKKKAETEAAPSANPVPSAPAE